MAINYINFDTSEGALIIKSAAGVVEETINLDSTGLNIAASSYDPVVVSYEPIHSSFTTPKGVIVNSAFRGYRVTCALHGYLTLTDWKAIVRAIQPLYDGRKLYFRPFQNYPDFEFEVAPTSDIDPWGYGNKTKGSYELKATLISKGLLNHPVVEDTPYYFQHAGWSLSFTGTAGENVTVPNALNMDPVDLTISMQFRVASLQDSCLCSKNGEYVIELNADGSIDWKPNVGTIISTPIDTYAVDTNYELECVFVNGGNSIIFLNKALNTFGASVGALAVNVNDLTIGTDAAGANGFVGYMDEFMYHTFARHIAVGYTESLESANRYGKIWLRMDEGTLLVAGDTTRYGNDGGLNGATKPQWFRAFEIWEADYAATLKNHWSDKDVAYLATDKISFWVRKNLVELAAG